MDNYYNEPQNNNTWKSKTISANFQYAQLNLVVGVAAAKVIDQLQVQTQDFLSTLPETYEIIVHPVIVEQFPTSGASIFAHQTIAYRNKLALDVNVINKNMNISRQSESNYDHDNDDHTAFSISDLDRDIEKAIKSGIMENLTKVQINPQTDYIPDHPESRAERDVRASVESKGGTYDPVLAAALHSFPNENDPSFEKTLDQLNLDKGRI